MVKKIRFLEIRSARRRRSEPRGAWVLEPRDAALLGAVLLLVFWVQVISQAS